MDENSENKQKPEAEGSENTSETAKMTDNSQSQDNTDTKEDGSPASPASDTKQSQSSPMKEKIYEGNGPTDLDANATAKPVFDAPKKATGFMAPTVKSDTEKPPGDGSNNVKPKPGRKNRPPPMPVRPLTDKEYEEIFEAVRLRMEAIESDPEDDENEGEENGNTDNVEKEAKPKDDFEAILEDESELNEAQADAAEPDAHSDEDEGQFEDAVENQDADAEEAEMAADEQQQENQHLEHHVHNGEAARVGNEATPYHSDNETAELSGAQTPGNPPELPRKKGSSAKKKKMAPKSLDFPGKKRSLDLNDKSTEKPQPKKKITERQPLGHVTNTGLHKEMKPKVQKETKPKVQTETKPKVQTETKPKFQTEMKPKVQTETKPKFQKEIKPKVQKEIKAKKQSRRESMKGRHFEEMGTWVQCGKTSCQKWRQLRDIHDPSELPEFWECSMHPDPKYNDCEKAEEDYQDLEEAEEFVFAKFTEGSLVWAKMTGWPWWPAMVEIDPDYSEYFECRFVKTSVSHYHVVFFDDKVSRAWVRAEILRPFTGKEKDMGSTKVKGTNYKESILEAKRRAIEALDLSLKERLEKYSFSARFSGKWGPAWTMSSQDTESGDERLPTSTKRGRKRKNREPASDADDDLADAVPEFEDDEVDALLEGAQNILDSAQEALECLIADDPLPLAKDEKGATKPDKEKNKKKRKSVTVCFDGSSSPKAKKVRINVEDEKQLLKNKISKNPDKGKESKPKPKFSNTVMKDDQPMSSKTETIATTKNVPTFGKSNDAKPSKLKSDKLSRSGATKSVEQNNEINPIEGKPENSKKKGSISFDPKDDAFTINTDEAKTKIPSPVLKTKKDNLLPPKEKHDQAKKDLPHEKKKAETKDSKNESMVKGGSKKLSLAKKPNFSVKKAEKQKDDKVNYKNKEEKVERLNKIVKKLEERIDDDDDDDDDDDEFLNLEVSTASKNDGVKSDSEDSAPFDVDEDNCSDKGEKTRTSSQKAPNKKGENVGAAA